MDSYSQENSQRRIQAVSQIRARVAKHLGSWLADHEAVSITIAAATRVAKETLEYLCSPLVARKAIEHAKTLAITTTEWDALFGAEARPLKVTALQTLSSDPQFSRAVSDVESALSITVEESQQKQIWSRQVTQAACTIAMYMDNHEKYISSCLGNIVRSDLRRLEDLQCALEDEGPDAMLIGSTLGSLSSCVT